MAGAIYSTARCVAIDSLKILLDDVSSLWQGSVMIKLTLHAAERIQKFRLDAAWIEATITAPDWTRPDPDQPGVTRSFKAIAARGGRVLRVAHRPDGGDVLVLSAFFDRGARP